MPKRSRKSSRDENQAAFDLVKQIEAATAEGKDPLAVMLGRRGGLKGGHARAAKMSKKERSESASQAARARWAKKRSGQ